MSEQYGGEAGLERMEDIVERYGARLYRLCLLYLGDRSLAEDALQDTLVKAWKNRASCRAEHGVYPWLASIAANVCRNALRTGWFRLWQRSVPLDKAFDLGQDAEMDHSVTDAVLRLPGMYREVVVLHYYEGYRLREIAALLHIPEQTANSRLNRARKLLRSELSEEVEA